MYKNFLSINKEKQVRIINACLAEFAANGYDKASTNSIVMKANISGILFHYFSNKKRLYIFLYETN